MGWITSILCFLGTISICSAQLQFLRPELMSGLSFGRDRSPARGSNRKPSTTSSRFSAFGGRGSSLLSSIYSGRKRPSRVRPPTSTRVSAAEMVVVPPVCAQPRGLLCPPSKYRTIDGTCNNVDHKTWGSIGLPQARLLPPQYDNGRDKPRRMGNGVGSLPSARLVSQKLHGPDSVKTESTTISHLFTVWGQFLDHDVTHTPVARGEDGAKVDCCNQPMLYPRRDLYWLTDNKMPENTKNPNCFPISLYPSGDRFFRNKCMNFVRSRAFAPSEVCTSETREQGNTQTSFIDGSQVYGVTMGNQLYLRSLVGGLLKSSQYDMLPGNSTTMCFKRPNSGDFCFGSGDPRVNEHPMLVSLHTVFHRLHNYLVLELAKLNPHWDDETLFQEGRKIVGAILQHMTYSEYLPLVLGPDEMRNHKLTIENYQDYRYEPNTDPSILNSFSAAAFRFGHSMVNGNNSFGFQVLRLRDMFFKPHFVQNEYGTGLTMVLNGLIRDRSQKRDRFMNLDLTDHLFQSKDGRSLDLAALNVQRGRDHGLPSYNDFRRKCGLPTLQEVISLGKMADVPFLDVYRDLEDVDLFSGGLAEEPLPGAIVGPTFACIIGKQFHNIKHGDRFWYQHTDLVSHEGALTPAQIASIELITLADVLCWVTELKAVQVSPFLEASAVNPATNCAEFLPLDLSAWVEFK